jgi:hypothetical protein
VTTTVVQATGAEAVTIKGVLFPALINNRRAVPHEPMRPLKARLVLLGENIAQSFLLCHHVVKILPE